MKIVKVVVRFFWGSCELKNKRSVGTDILEYIKANLTFSVKSKSLDLLD